VTGFSVSPSRAQNDSRPQEVLGDAEALCGIVQSFERQAEWVSEAPALTFGGASLTYGELNRRANQLSHYLIRHKIGPETVVAVLLPRGFEAVVAILAILKAGGAYLPLDPKNPAERLSDLLRDANPTLVITNQGILQGFATSRQAVFLDLEETVSAIRCCPPTNPSSTSKLGKYAPDAAAYILYTSGSTGKPKAVIGLHRGLINRLNWFYGIFPQAAQQTVLSRSSLGFIDGSTELLGPLTRGCHIVLASQQDSADPVELCKLTTLHGVGQITLTPSFLLQFLTPEFVDSLTQCRFWICSGEFLPESTIRRFFDLFPDSHLINLYGCSEVSGDSLCDSSHLTPKSIGKPIWQTHAYVLDDELDPTPTGAVGELYLSGTGLARGYMAHPGSTAERFVPDVFKADGSRMYRTGDLAIMHRSGNIEFLGRSDHQIKIRGIRLELGEVEDALRCVLPVREVLAVAQRDRHNEIQLYAYVRLAESCELTGIALRRMLIGIIPDHMIPSIFVVLENIPYTISGKIDRQALPRAVFDPVAESDLPQSSAEVTLCKIFAEILGVPGVSAEANLFDLGVHSLVATRIASRIRREFQVECTVAKLLEAQSIAVLATMLHTSERVSRPKIRPR
jgi:amino acid adenylation domain-containing protein